MKLEGLGVRWPRTESNPLMMEVAHVEHHDLETGTLVSDKFWNVYKNQ